jgi:hypothetical protein
VLALASGRRARTITNILSVIGERMRIINKVGLLPIIVLIVLATSVYANGVENDRQKAFILEVKKQFSFNTKYILIIERFGKPILENIKEIHNQHIPDQIDEYVQMHYESIDFYFYFIKRDRDSQLLDKVVINDKTGVSLFDDLFKYSFSDLQKVYGGNRNKDRTYSVYSLELGYEITFEFANEKVDKIILECGLD